MLITFTLRYRIRSLIWLCKNVLEFVWAFDFQKMKTDLGMIPIILWVPSSSLLRINISFYSIAKSTPTHFTARQVNTTNFHISQTIMIKKGNYIFFFCLLSSSFNISKQKSCLHTKIHLSERTPKPFSHCHKKFLFREIISTDGKRAINYWMAFL